MAVSTSWQEGRNSIVTTVSRKTAHRLISFLIAAVSAPERHWISHFARAAHATYSVGMVWSSGRKRSSGCSTHYWASEASPTLGCSIEISRDWAGEASPTLGCSIEISRDICRYVVCLSYVKLTA